MRETAAPSEFVRAGGVAQGVCGFCARIVQDFCKIFARILPRKSGEKEPQNLQKLLQNRPKSLQKAPRGPLGGGSGTRPKKRAKKGGRVRFKRGHFGTPFFDFFSVLGPRARFGVSAQIAATTAISGIGPGAVRGRSGTDFERFWLQKWLPGGPLCGVFSGA